MQSDLDQAVIVALGSNLAGPFPSSAAVIEAALARLAESGVTPVRVSSLWRSSAWPDPTDPDYLNAVALVETTLAPRALLALLHALEAEFGPRSGPPNAPRVLDLDLIAYGRLVSDDAGVILPHPRAAARRFVMGPLAEIAPEWVHPVLLRRAELLAASARVGGDALPLAPSGEREGPARPPGRVGG